MPERKHHFFPYDLVACGLLKRNGYSTARVPFAHLVNSAHNWPRYQGRIRTAAAPAELRLALSEGKRLRQYLGIASDPKILMPVRRMFVNDDGRIKSINSTQTGKGLETVKALVDLVPLTGFSLAARNITAATNASACDELRKINKGPAFDDQVWLVKACGSAIDDERRVLHCNNETSKSVLHLALREPGAATLSVEIEQGGREDTRTFEIAVSQFGQDYALPIQKPPLFGENRFELSLAEAGNVTKLKYGSTPGVDSALAAASAARDSGADPTATEQAAEAKAQADLIVQQQRLIRCNVDPANCK